jgi:hypothetical protein
MEDPVAPILLDSPLNHNENRYGSVLPNLPLEYTEFRAAPILVNLPLNYTEATYDSIHPNLPLDYTEFRAARILVNLPLNYTEATYDSIHPNLPLKYTEDISVITKHPKYDVFISYAYEDYSIIKRIKRALPPWYSTHTNGNYSATNTQFCLDNTSAAVIAIINKVYESSEAFQADMTYIFKRQFPLVLVLRNNDFKPSTNWLTIVWNAWNTQKVFLHLPNFEESLRNAIADAQWNLSPHLYITKITESATNDRSQDFIGDLYEVVVTDNKAARVSQTYRQLINDPFRIETDTKLRDIYFKYIRTYFEKSDVTDLFEIGARENDIHYFIQAYTQTSAFNTTLNRHLADNVLYYFKSTLHDTVDYQLVKCLIDFVTLFIYRQELRPYLFSGTVYRGMNISEKNLSKYVIGSRIVNTSFLSTSRDKHVAEIFCGQNQHGFPVLCTYIIHNKNNRRTALNIESVSYFRQEQEVLILPFSPFYVESVTQSSSRVELIEIVLIEVETGILENIDTTTQPDY